MRFDSAELASASRRARSVMMKRLEARATWPRTSSAAGAMSCSHSPAFIISAKCAAISAARPAVETADADAAGGDADILGRKVEAARDEQRGERRIRFVVVRHDQRLAADGAIDIGQRVQMPERGGRVAEALERGDRERGTARRRR